MKLLSSRWFPALVAVLFLSAAAGRANTDHALDIQIVGAGTVNLSFGRNTKTVIATNQSLALPDNAKCTLNAKPKPGFKFAGWTGDFTSAKTKLTFVSSNDVSLTAAFVDASRPKLKVNPVPNPKALTSDTIILGGSARDNAGAANVLYQVNEAGWESASTFNQWSNWWFTVYLEPGVTNFVEVYAEDVNGLTSKTNKLQLVQAFAPDSLVNLNLDIDGLGVLNFGTNTFTELFDGIGGVGSYQYKKTSSVSGKLTLVFSDPPSVKGFAQKTTVNLQFFSDTDGDYSDSAGNETSFTLSDVNDFGAPAMTGATLIFSANDNVHQSVVGFPEPPTVSADASWNVHNPLEIALDSDYTGQLGDRVKVTFEWNQYLFINGAWVTVSTTPSIPGTVIDIGDATVTVFFDNLPLPDAQNEFRPLGDAPLQILSFAYTDYVDGSPVGNGSGTFTYAQTSPDGGLLKLNRAGTNQIVTMYFTEDASGGDYYEEDYDANNNLVGSANGVFALALPPQIVTSPVSQIVSNGYNASFTVKASGTPPLTYQWQFNSTNLVDGTNAWGSVIAGATTTNLVITGVSSNDLGSYRVMVNNAFGTTYSSAATLAFPAPQDPPQITNQPPANIYTTNQFNLTINVGATGTAPLAYQWQYLGANPGNAGTNLVNTVFISGVTSNTLAFTPVFTNNAGYYQVVITNLYGSVTSTPATFLNVVTNQF